MAISTCGGDCPGLNAAIAAATTRANALGFETVGVRDGMSGFIDGAKDIMYLTPESVRGIHALGGTILGTSNKGSPFRDPQSKKQSIAAIKKTWKELGLDAMLTIGGDGSHWMMKELVEAGLNIVGIPKTIDNDLSGSELTIGFSTAVSTATTAASALRHSADSHSRIMILEVMGRDSGHIALSSGLASVADCILLPEIPFDLAKVAKHHDERTKYTRGSYVIVAAEGATPRGKDQLYKSAPSGSKVLGGVGQLVADHLHEMTGADARATVLGHVQRGGIPDHADRILAQRFATYAVNLIEKREYGHIVGIKGDKLYHFPYAKMKETRYKIPGNSDLMRTAEDMGICLGR